MVLYVRRQATSAGRQAGRQCVWGQVGARRHPSINGHHSQHNTTHHTPHRNARQRREEPKSGSMCACVDGITTVCLSVCLCAVCVKWAGGALYMYPSDASRPPELNGYVITTLRHYTDRHPYKTGCAHTHSEGCTHTRKEGSRTQHNTTRQHAAPCKRTHCPFRGRPVGQKGCSVCVAVGSLTFTMCVRIHASIHPSMQDEITKKEKTTT
mmetsp:Transcript_11875/g.34505  ORF Transcript_11875/g.34505 Transcript_11875/m.34505 type:complete len:210 (-) Transcript_11875:521-1150(-)